MTRTRAALAATVLSVAALSACSVSVGSEPSYDGAELADKVVAEQEKVTPDLEVADGTCEEDVTLEVGAVIGCSITIDGVEAPYDVEVESLEGESASYRIAPAQAIVSVEKVTEIILEQAAAQGLDGVEVDCGDAAVVVQDPRPSFRCTLTMGERSQEGTVTMDDLDGNVSLQF